jgi:hypothetical protein
VNSTTGSATKTWLSQTRRPHPATDHNIISSSCTLNVHPLYAKHILPIFMSCNGLHHRGVLVTPHEHTTSVRTTHQSAAYWQSQKNSSIYGAHNPIVSIYSPCIISFNHKTLLQMSLLPRYIYIHSQLTCYVYIPGFACPAPPLRKRKSP